MAKVVRPGDTIRISERALSDRSWVSDTGIGLLGVGIMAWLLDAPDPVPVERMAVGYDESMQEILDKVAVLVRRCLVDVAEEGPGLSGLERCVLDTAESTHA